MKMKFFAQKPLAISFMLALFMAATEAPLWMSGFALILVLWKWMVEKKNWWVLPRKVTGALSVLVIVEVYFQYRNLLGQEPTNTILLGLAGLKLMDYENERDHKFITLLAFIMVSLKALFSLDFYWIFPTLAAFVGLWYSLIDRGVSHRWRLLLRIFAFSIPLAMIFFFAFPRVVIPWAMSRRPDSAVMGFSDGLNPSQVAELASSDTTAFRARFLDGHRWRQEDLYWRGSVLKTSHGLRWSPARLSVEYMHQKIMAVGTPYEVMLEPAAQNFIFVLEEPLSVNSDSIPVVSFEADVYRSTVPIRASAVYQATSLLHGIDVNPPGEEYLQLPNLSERVQKWVDETKNKYTTPEARLQALKDFFSDPGFQYTVKPGSYGKNELEEFLFDRKRGFCEHFAGSYATLARALGLPARVVIGYQGGQYNPYGNFWRIAQRSAHAWAEVYIHKQWQREDPTDWVAPLRLSMGAEGFFSLSEVEQKEYARNLDWRPVHSSGVSWWDKITDRYEDLNYQWTYFLMDFDKESQQNIWTVVSAHLKQILSAILIAMVLMMAISRLRHSPSSKKEIQKIMEDIFAWGAQQGLPRGLSEPPLQYLQRLAESVPLKKEPLEQSMHVYDQMVYQMQISVKPQELRALLARVRE